MLLGIFILILIYIHIISIHTLGSEGQYYYNNNIDIIRFIQLLIIRDILSIYINIIIGIQILYSRIELLNNIINIDRYESELIDILIITLIPEWQFISIYYQIKCTSNKWIGISILLYILLGISITLIHSINQYIDRWRDQSLL